jgi:hypothetical protein
MQPESSSGIIGFFVIIASLLPLKQEFLPEYMEFEAMSMVRALLAVFFISSLCQPQQCA